MRAIEQLIPAIKAALPGTGIDQLKTKYPADDDGLWFVRHPDCDVEINLESSTGEFPFLIENSRNDTRITTSDFDEVIAVLKWTFGRYRRQGSSAA